MFINKSKDGKNNLCGTSVASKRKEMKLSQRELAVRLQREGLDVDKNAVQRIESRQRFVTDIELVYLGRVLNMEIKDLLK